MRHAATIVLLLALVLPARASTTYSGPVESNNGFTVNGVPVCLADGTNCICVCTTSTTTTMAPTTTTATPTTTTTTTTTTATPTTSTTTTSTSTTTATT